MLPWTILMNVNSSITLPLPRPLGSIGSSPNPRSSRSDTLNTNADSSTLKPTQNSSETPKTNNNNTTRFQAQQNAQAVALYRTADAPPKNQRAIGAYLQTQQVIQTSQGGTLAGIDTFA
jgi:hypothetical protein